MYMLCGGPIIVSSCKCDYTFSRHSHTCTNCVLYRRGSNTVIVAITTTQTHILLDATPKEGTLTTVVAAAAATMAMTKKEKIGKNHTYRINDDKILKNAIKRTSERRLRIMGKIVVIHAHGKICIIHWQSVWSYEKESRFTTHRAQCDQQWSVYVRVSDVTQNRNDSH